MALVDEAHRQGIAVAAHSLTLSGAKMAVAAGVDSIEHGFAISADLAAEMVARGTALVPTLLVTRELAAHGSQISEPVRAAHDRSFVNCLEAGVRIVLGTDVGGFEWTRVSQAEEFTLMTRQGLSAADALRAGTLCAAELLGLAGTTGSSSPARPPTSWPDWRNRKGGRAPRFVHADRRAITFRRRGAGQRWPGDPENRVVLVRARRSVQRGLRAAPENGDDVTAQAH